jgi:hypothetical protein
MDWCRLQVDFLENAISVFTNDIICGDPPDCPADVVLSHTWMHPNGCMFNVSLTSVPTQDQSELHLPGWINIHDVEFYDNLDKRLPIMPLAEWTPGHLTSEATVSVSKAPIGLVARAFPTEQNSSKPFRP